MFNNSSTITYIIVLAVMALVGYAMRWLPPHFKQKIEQLGRFLLMAIVPLAIVGIVITSLSFDDPSIRLFGLTISSTVFVWIAYIAFSNSYAVRSRLQWRIEWLYWGVIIFTFVMVAIWLSQSEIGLIGLIPLGGMLLIGKASSYEGNRKARILQSEPIYAVEHYTKQISMRPYDPWNYLGRAEAKKKLGDFEAAIADFDIVAEMLADYKQKPSKLSIKQVNRVQLAYHIERGNLLLAMDAPTDALAEYESALASRHLLPTDEFVLIINSAITNMELDKIDVSIQLLDDAENKLSAFTPKNRKNGNAHLSVQRSLAYYRQGDMEQALVHWRQAIAAIPENGDSEKLSETHIGPQWRLDAMLDLNERLKALA